ncbi:restriction endonuclease [Natrinema gari]|uniref:restriction endonuclease n=1 Tax=Natrinema gari TaxID=419186 RepID=UPI001267B107|nr:restriction endonuclease [Natrinema gari]
MKRYADRQWRQDLCSRAQTLDDKFDINASAEEESPVVQSIQTAPRENLQDWSQRLEQFAVLKQTLSRLSFEELPVARTEVQSLAAQTWTDNDTATANDLNDVLTGVDSGFEVRIRGQRYDGAKLLDQPLANFPSSKDDQLEQAAADINRFEEARTTVELWSQPSSSPPDSGKSKLAVRVDSQVVEPTALWERLDTILTVGTLEQFCEQAKAVEGFAAQTEPLRSNSGSSHPLSAGQAQATTIENARNAVQEGDSDGTEKAMVKAEAWVAEQELAEMFTTTDLTHSSIDPTEVQNRLDQARATDDYTHIKSIRDEVMAQLDSTWQPSDLLSLTPTQFEEVLGQLYQKKGYDVQVTQQSGDRGIDAIARNGQRTIAIQAKRYDPNGAGNVSGPEVRNAIGATVQEGADVCVVATSSGFTQDARRAAMETKGVEVQLLSGRNVIQKLSESQIPNPT